jgi:hypothetical protein
MVARVAVLIFLSDGGSLAEEGKAEQREQLLAGGRKEIALKCRKEAWKKESHFIQCQTF